MIVVWPRINKKMASKVQYLRIYLLDSIVLGITSIEDVRVTSEDSVSNFVVQVHTAHENIKTDVYKG